MQQTAAAEYYMPYLELLHGVGQAAYVDEEDIWLLLQQRRLHFMTDATT
jgi:hypothetical protein